jgi:hypothetical protein
MSRDIQEIKKDILYAEEEVEKLKNKIVSPLYKELNNAEVQIYNSLLIKINEDDPSDVDLALTRFDSFSELETVHLTRYHIHHTKPLNILDIFSGWFDRGRTVRVFERLPEIEISMLVNQFDFREEEAKKLLVETIHNTIKDKVVEFIFDW